MKRAEPDIDTLKATLREGGLRATSPRLAVLRLLQGSSAPLSHADVAEALASEGLDRATVYRNLIDLADAKLVRKADLGDHVWRFELASASHSAQAHAHFVCGSCGTVECLPDTAVELHASRSTPRALKKRGVEIQVRGLCDTCE